MMEQRKKTFKRELAVLMVGFLMFLAIEGKVDELEVLVWPFSTFVVAAFGIDATAKQLQQGTPVFTRRGSQRSSQRPSREDKLPDGWDNEGK